jgi:hypothetical protein
MVALHPLPTPSISTPTHALAHARAFPIILYQQNVYNFPATQHPLPHTLNHISTHNCQQNVHNYVDNSHAKNPPNPLQIQKKLPTFALTKAIENATWLRNQETQHYEPLWNPQIFQNSSKLNES